MGKIVSVNISSKKHVVKRPVDKAELVPGKGMAGDAHFGFGKRQVSLLKYESIEKQRKELARKSGKNGAEPGGVKPADLLPGVYAENLTTSGLALEQCRLGDELKVGDGIRLMVTKIGKECHTKCDIYYAVGDCVMPKEGIFCEVLEGGTVRPGDEIERC